MGGAQPRAERDYIWEFQRWRRDKNAEVVAASSMESWGKRLRLRYPQSGSVPVAQVSICRKAGQTRDRPLCHMCRMRGYCLIKRIDGLKSSNPLNAHLTSAPVQRTAIATIPLVIDPTCPCQGAPSPTMHSSMHQ
jgi:hypothetical protein